MELAITTAALYSAGALTAAVSAFKAKSRLELTRAKHASLTGHSRMARLVASLVPYYHYDETRFFNADGAPDVVASRRRSDFVRLADLYRTRYPRTLELT
jgi:glutamate-1-semialdehyde 2,1-aminomutase